jgi:beta-glucosidase
MALEMARQSIVLLKNEGQLLPLDQSIRSLLITGPLAASNALVGDWVHTQPDENIITVVEGIEELVSGQVEVEHYDCGDLLDITEDSIKTAKKKAERVDTVVVVVGGNDSRSDLNWDLKFDRPNRSGGENIARSNIDLVGRQLDLVKAIHSTGTPLVVVLINGRPLATEWIAENVPSVVEAWQPGMQGGTAVAEVLFGHCNPSGKLPITIPRGVGHLLSFYNHRPMTYLRSYKYGQTGPLFEFGHGLSYTTFEYGELQVPQRVLPGSEAKIGVEVTNTGARAGDEVVLVFVNDVVSSVTTPTKELKAFKRIHLEAGQKKRVEFSLSTDELAIYDVNMRRTLEPGKFEVMIGDLKGEFEVVDRLSSIVLRSRIL